MCFLLICLQKLCNLLQSQRPRRLLLPLLPCHMRNRVKGKSFVYNDISFGLSFKSYTTPVLVALALDFNGLQLSCTSYQWQSGLFGSFTMTACARRHQLGSCCSASCIKFILHLPFSVVPSLFFSCRTLFSPTLNYRLWHTWCRLTALFFHGCCLRRLFINLSCTLPPLSCPHCSLFPELCCSLPWSLIHDIIGVDR